MLQFYALLDRLFRRIDLLQKAAEVLYLKCAFVRFFTRIVYFLLGTDSLKHSV